MAAPTGSSGQRGRGGSSVGGHAAAGAAAAAGTLAQLGGCVPPLPSTLCYRERTQLKAQDAYTYSRIYNSATGCSSVFDRLTADASVRHTVKRATAPPPPDGGSFAAMATAAAVAAAASAAAGMSRSARPGLREPISGFVSNDPGLSSRHGAGTASSGADPPLSSLHALTLRSYYKRFPLDCLAAARPQARTVNETLAVLGTFGEGDRQLAARLGLPAAACSARQQGLRLVPTHAQPAAGAL